jgi:glucuronoarabinoxylan endo-1,4-beta-xylanase
MYKIKIIYSFFLMLFALPSLFAQSVTVTWTNTHQTIDGFGAACDDIGACEGMSPTQAANVFSPSTGIGLSIFRDAIPFDGSCSTNCEFRSPNTEAYAVSFGATIMATPWSPPASMKSNGSIVCNTGSGKGVLLSGSYTAYAAYLKAYATQFQSTYGKSIYSISVQNEPDFCSTDPNYGWGASWTGAQIDTFVKNNLGPTFSGSGIKIMMPEVANWSNLATVADPVMTDSTAAAFAGVVAGHAYGGGTAAYATRGSARLWETEVYIPKSGAFDGSMANALIVAQNIHAFLATANANAYLYWRIYNSGGANNNESLIQADGTVAQRFYVLGNWSKFVRPGWVRIDATANPQSGVYVSAFKDPTAGGFALVAINQNSSPVTVDFSLSGFPSVTSVTPALTSASVNLVDQENANVSDGAFSYSLPANSVITFHSATSSVSSKLPATPTNLALTVH